MIINVKKTNKDAIIPMFAHPTDSGFDLFTCEDVTILGGKKGIAKTGLIFEIKRGPGLGSYSRADRGIGGVRPVAPPTWLVSNFLVRPASS